MDAPESDCSSEPGYLRFPIYPRMNPAGRASNCGTGELEGRSLVHGGPSFGVEQKTEGGACSAGGGAPVWRKRLGAGLGAREAEPGCGATGWGRGSESGRRNHGMEQYAGGGTLREGGGVRVSRRGLGAPCWSVDLVCAPTSLVAPGGGWGRQIKETPPG